MRALILSTLMLVACGSTTKPASSTAVTSAAPPAPSVALADPLALIPANSDLVVKFDGVAARKSTLWAKYENDMLGFIAPALVECGYNPLRELSSVIVGIPMNEELGVFVFRGIDREKTLGCLRTSTRETETTATFDGEVVKLLNKSGNLNLMTFLDARTMVIQGSKGPTKETLKQALQIGAPLRDDRAYVALEQTVAPGAAIAFISRPGSKVVTELLASKLGKPVEHMVLSVHVTDKLTVHAEFALQNAADAGAFADSVGPQLEVLERYVERYDVQARGSTLVVDIAASEAQIQALVALAKSLMGNSLGTN